jgi:hypothetical protein
MCMYEHMVWVVVAGGLIVRASEEKRRDRGYQTQEIDKVEVNSEMHS